MRRLVVIALIGIIGIAFAVGAFFYLYNKPKPDIGGMRPSITTTAVEMIGMFTRDRDGASTMFNNQVVQVAGKVRGSEVSSNGMINLYLDGKDGIVQCELDRSQTAKDSGMVTVKGYYTGHEEDMIDGHIVKLNKCFVAEDENNPARAVAGEGK